MSVVILDMEMPKSCDDCLALDDYGDYPRCRITEEQRGYNFRVREMRMDKCPLIELPPLTTSMPQLNISSPILDPEWQKAHKAMGFWSPLADLYEELGIIETEEDEDG